MIRPKRAFIIGRAAPRISRNAASRLTRMTSSNSSSFIRISKLSRVMPALLTRMSSFPPNASTACGTSPSTAAPSERLQGSATCSPPSSDRKASSLPTLLPETASRAPCAASALAISLPSPPDAPVTSAVIPDRSNIHCSIKLIHAETRRRGGSVMIDHSSHAFLESRTGKVDEQPDGLLSEPEVCEKLLHMCIAERFHGLDLDQQSIVD